MAMPWIPGFDSGGSTIPGQGAVPGQPALTGQAGTQGAGQVAGTGQTAADTLNQIYAQGGIQTGLQQMGDTSQQQIAQLQSDTSKYNAGLGLAGGIANDIFSGANAMAQGAQAGNYGLAGTAMGLEPQLYKQGIENQILPQMAQFIGPLMNQLGPAIGNILGGGYGGGQGGGLPAGASSPANAPIPLSVMNPYSAQGLINQAAGGTAASTANQLGAVTPPGASDALSQQLAGQAFGGNRAGLTDASQNFLSQLAPLNAQQALTGAQTAEGQRGNYLGNILARQQVGNQATGNILNFLNSLTGTALRG